MITGGLQDPIRGTVCSFDIERGEFLQILHNRYDHWLLVSTLGVSEGGVVLVYDSKYSHLTSHTELQIASLIHTPRSHICVKFIDVPTQSGDSECGIFAIAYATALSLKEDPGKIEFAESGLRNHLYKCLKNKKMTIFPVLRRRRAIRIKCTENIKIYCQCRLPEIGSMVECSRCLEWFHVSTCAKPSKKALH